MDRRQFLTLAAAAAVARPRLLPAVAQPVDGRAAAELTTLAQTLRPGAPAALGYRPVVSGPGELYLLREELAAARAGRVGRRRSLVSFVHLTDQHIIDVQSPSRVEFLDRAADGRCGRVPVSSAHRPQEAASARIADAMLRRVRAISVSPVTGAPISAAICTGDNTDNQQRNELDVFLGIMNGGRVLPQSGDPARYEGVQASGDRSYWHPDPAVDDLYKTVFGFPARAGWLEAALAPFDAVGVGRPWYTCFGNHDGLAQGNAPVNPLFEAFGTGATKVVGPPAGVVPCGGLAGSGAVSAPAFPVTADPARRYVSRREWIAAHLGSGGHGFTAANLETQTLYYTADVGAVRFVVLDTVNPGGKEDGSIGERQLRWLDARLAEAQAARRLVLLFSHHGPRSLTNPVDAPDPLDPASTDLPRHRADAVLGVVDRYSCVVAWINGHSHRNVVRARGGWWDVGTAAHIDWPAQARLVELVDNRDGTLSLFTTMIDHEDDEVVSFARELGGNDPHAGFADGTGGPEDRNLELVVADPFA
jgi:metallophosphoesterase (TIGR03767 family)